MKQTHLFFLTFLVSLTSFILPVHAQTWYRHQENNYNNVVAIVKPRRSGYCGNHFIRQDGRVYDARRGTRGSYLIVDQVVSLTGVIETNNRGEKIWQVFYQPSRTTMWLHDCDLSIPRIAD